MNTITISGRIGRSAKQQFLSDGTSLVTFSIFSDEFYTNSEGETKKRTDILPVACFGPYGERVHKYLTKGRKISIVGQLRSKSWETDNGKRRVSLEVHMDRVEFHDPKPGKKENGKKAEEKAPEDENVFDGLDDLPAEELPPVDSYEEDGEGSKISDDDINDLI